MLGVIKRDRRRVDIVVLRHRPAQCNDANALLIPSGRWRGNAISTIVRRIIIHWRDRNLIHRRDRKFDEPKRECRVIGGIGRRCLRRHRGALLFGRADDERVLTGRKSGRRMLSLASRSAVQIGKAPAQIAKFRGDALRPALHAPA
jgi:hypothetical protein